ncbi:bifunctional tetrahydrofolate synthase/dihydrofolate synthase [Conchiformibius kuhniae]|uniref:Dihydrofolate synthase/folylpolyglutamate synthase n=1 Tax=Conchiformibius kuhniae TaxID=211502 RepID=A0ABD8B7R7_9NEIS|nr:bifunctional tetrahydrofolate synthase/dihydrofolate synthase [Conchiformibius kuhniae]
MNHSQTLTQWLAHLETAHTGGLIDMGLERISRVKEIMNLRPTCPVIAVAGTNGKGSVCAFLSKIYREAGYKTGTLTSPHLLRFNERIALNCRPVSDRAIVESFERIEAARGDTSLTYFEFNTLAAVDIFMREQVDVMILEVGLGGRLDAVNAFDADCAVITAVDIDHQAYLGDNIEDIAFEKAGIFRKGKPAVCGHTPPPARLREHARATGAPLLLAKQDFDHSVLDSLQWSFRFAPLSGSFAPRKRHALPTPALRGSCQIRNAACALAAIECLNDRLPVDIGAIKRGLLTAENPARFQVLPGRPLTVLDVAHNPHAARALRQNLLALPFAAKRTAVFSILADKDIDGVIEAVKDQFDQWYTAPLNVPRALPLPDLNAKLAEHGVICNTSFPDIAAACRAALSDAAENDRIVVFGSFHTVAEAAAVCCPPAR